MSWKLMSSHGSQVLLTELQVEGQWHLNSFYTMSHHSSSLAPLIRNRCDIDLSSLSCETTPRTIGMRYASPTAALPFFFSFFLPFTGSDKISWFCHWLHKHGKFCSISVFNISEPIKTTARCSCPFRDWHLRLVIGEGKKKASTIISFLVYFECLIHFFSFSIGVRLHRKNGVCF